MMMLHTTDEGLSSPSLPHSWHRRLQQHHRSGANKRRRRAFWCHRQHHAPLLVAGFAVIAMLLFCSTVVVTAANPATEEQPPERSLRLRLRRRHLQQKDSNHKKQKNVVETMEELIGVAWTESSENAGAAGVIGSGGGSGSSGAAKPLLPEAAEHGEGANNSSNTTSQEEQQQGVSSGKKNKKPRFVIHVGPMKTATSSLQADLDWLLGDELGEDGWMYTKMDSPFNDIPTDDPELFLQRFQQEADKLLATGLNVIRSREQYSAYFGERPWMYEQLRDRLSPHWDVTIVAGYRPYHEWIPSFWYQNFRMPYSDPDHPEDRARNPWRHENTGDLYEIEPMFPDYYHFWTGHHRFTDSIVDQAGPVFDDVQVYDIRDSRGARSAFLCGALQGAAPAACRRSVELHAAADPPHRVNPSHIREIQYDAVALAAVARGLVNEQKWHRSEVVDAIAHRQEDELGLTVTDFPLICPEPAVYEEFLRDTLRLDEKCLPGRWQQQDDDNAEQKNHREQELRDSFQAAVDQKKYCHVDPDAVLDDPDWQAFFAAYA